MTPQETVTFNTSLSYITAGVGAVNTLYSSIHQAKTAKLRGKFEALQHETNARFASMQANEVIKQGNALAQNNDRKISKLIGSQRARLAAQGIDIDSGSAAEMQDVTRELGMLDSANIRNNAWRQAFGFKQRALQDQLNASAAKIGAKATARNTVATGLINISNQALTLSSDKFSFSSDKDKR